MKKKKKKITLSCYFGYGHTKFMSHESNNAKYDKSCEDTCSTISKCNVYGIPKIKEVRN